MTEEELRAAAMEAVRERADAMGKLRYPDLAPREFTRRDWAGDEKSPAAYATIVRELDTLLAEGLVARAKRRDPRVGKTVWGYWYVG